MKRVKLSKASRSLAQYVTELADDVVIVTDGDQPLAALIPLKNAEGESLALSTHPDFIKLVKRSRTDFERGETVSLDEMRALVRRMRSPQASARSAAGTQRRRKTARRTRARRN